MTWQQKFYSKFEQSFSDDENTNPIRFIDGIGYSIVDHYPSSYKRLMRAGKGIDYKPLYKFAVISKDSEGEYMPMYISAALTVEETDGGAARYILSYERPRGVLPIDFTSTDDFFIKRSTGELFEKSGSGYKKTTYDEMFGRVRRLHLSKLRDIRAVFRRTKILVIRKLPSLLLSCVAFLCGIVCWVIEGKRFTYDVIEESLTGGFGTTTVTKQSKLPEEQIDFFGYKVSIWTLFTFSLLVLVYTVAADHYVFPFKKILSEPGPILTIALAIICIVIYDKLIPKAGHWSVKKSQINAYNLKYKSVKMKI